jgi:hypothetical protein
LKNSPLSSSRARRYEAIRTGSLETDRHSILVVAFAAAGTSIGNGTVPAAQSGIIFLGTVVTLLYSKQQSRALVLGKEKEEERKRKESEREKERRKKNRINELSIF